MPTAVPTHDPEAQAVGPGMARNCGGGHAEERDGRFQVGREREVIEGDGLGQVATRPAVHWTRVSLALAGAEANGES